MVRPLSAAFFRQDAPAVARELIGCLLQTPTHVARLVETEAYLPANDAACHASRGPTPRTLPMFQPGGILYVYFIYGMYWCSNIVADAAGKGAAVLLRSAIVYPRTSGLDRPKEGGVMVKGPGRLSNYLGFNGTYTGRSVLRGSTIVVRTDAETPWFQTQVIATPRIGIRVATDLLLRFVVLEQQHTARNTRNR